MKSVKEIRNEIRFAKDNGLTLDQIEALEIEMWEAETSECAALTQEKEECKEVSSINKSDEYEKRLCRELDTIKCTNQYATVNKVWYMRKWFNGLIDSDKEFVINNALEVYRKHTANKFKILAGE